MTSETQCARPACCALQAVMAGLHNLWCAHDPTLTVVAQQLDVGVQHCKSTLIQSKVVVQSS